MISDRICLSIMYEQLINNLKNMRSIKKISRRRSGLTGAFSLHRTIDNPGCVYSRADYLQIVLDKSIKKTNIYRF